MALLGVHSLVIQLALLAIALVLGACSPVPAAPASKGGGWDAVLAAAKQEGTVVVAGAVGENLRAAHLAFANDYPEIKVEYTGQNGRDLVPKVLAERSAGHYAWDVFTTGAPSSYLLKAAGALDPIRPALLLPEVLDDSKWIGGFASGFVDSDRQLAYAFTGYLQTNVWVNRDVIPEPELSSVEQLVDPKWKGRISWSEPRQPGSGQTTAGYWLKLKGEEWLRQLYRQDVTIVRDSRQQIEWVVANRYPIAIGVDQTLVPLFRDLGFTTQLQALASDSPLGARLSTSVGVVTLMNRAPHPNAARVYINWLLSARGQEPWARLMQQNSRRLDVPGPPEFAPKPDVQYIDPTREENVSYLNRASEIAREFFD
jgi:iron(III) transport system substrate-binding protein